jgi:enoyl-CoA hydratase
LPGTVRVEVEQGLATLWLERGHGNAINGDLVDDLHRACRAAGDDPAVRGAMLAGAGKLFCPGLDLKELVELERPEMERFVERFSACVLALYTFPKPLVARIHGHAVAGGCVLALTADWRVVAEPALVGLNEVRVGVPLPYGVAQILRESVPPSRVEEVALFGRNYRGAEAVAAGLVHEVRAEAELDGHCRTRLGELAGKDARAFAVTKRYLRAPVVERLEAHEGRLRHEFLDGWFSPATRATMRQIVGELRKKKKGSDPAAGSDPVRR